jgi:hypothetical protein
MAQGTRIPVVSVEKLRFESGGRGLYIDDDATNFDVASWTGVSGGALSCEQKFLPAPSAIAWWKVNDNGGTSYYIPLFREVL